MRLIDADELKAEFDLIASKSATGNLQTIPIEHIKQIIDNASPIEQEVYIDGEDYNFFIKGYKEGRKDFERPKGEWIVTAEDNDGVHRICCPFCSYEKGSNNTDPIIVTFTNFPKFCENCGADMRGEEE